MKRRKPTQKGVSANSHALSHHYADEGEKGKLIRRKVRKLEKRQWRKEAEEEK